MSHPMHILAIDIGGTKIKMLASGMLEPRKVPSGPKLTPQKMVDIVKKTTKDWRYEVISIGFPGLVGKHGVRADPGNLGSGWVSFDFVSAFGMPTKVINDAAMQALGSYEGGRMLFLGLGTGVGSTLIADRVVTPLELGSLPYRKGRTIHDSIGRRGLESLGRRRWRAEVLHIATLFHHAFSVDYVVLGGGNSRLMRQLGPTLPAGVRIGHNRNAFRGGYRLWGYDLVPTLTAEHDEAEPASAGAEWRMV